MTMRYSSFACEYAFSMAAFDEIRPGARIRGIAGSEIAEIVSVSKFGPDALNVVFRSNGKVQERLFYRSDEAAFTVEEAGRSFAFPRGARCICCAATANAFSP